MCSGSRNFYFIGHHPLPRMGNATSLLLRTLTLPSGGLIRPTPCYGTLVPFWFSKYSSKIYAKKIMRKIYPAYHQE